MFLELAQGNCRKIATIGLGLEQIGQVTEEVGCNKTSTPVADVDNYPVDE